MISNLEQDNAQLRQEVAIQRQKFESKEQDYQVLNAENSTLQKNVSDYLVELSKLRKEVQVNKTGNDKLFKDIILKEEDEDNYLKTLGVLDWDGQLPVWANLQQIDTEKVS